MRSTIHTLGWFVRRVAHHAALAQFYAAVVGLPVQRTYASTSMHAAGETMCFEISEGGSPPPLYLDRSIADCTPIFRVPDIQRTIHRLKTAGVPFLQEFDLDHNYIAYFLDPSGHLTGIQERYRTSPQREDQEAWRRWDAGETTVPGVPPLAPDIQHLAWIMLRVEDVEAEVAFYRDVIGLDVVTRFSNSAALSMGGMQLHIASGGLPLTIPKDRSEANNVPVLRVMDIDGMMADLAARGVRIVNDMFSIDGGRIAYVADPEGHLLGIQQRTPQTTRPEDHEAMRRWKLGLV